MKSARYIHNVSIFYPQIERKYIKGYGPTNLTHPEGGSKTVLSGQLFIRPALAAGLFFKLSCRNSAPFSVNNTFVFPINSVVFVCRNHSAFKLFTGLASAAFTAW